MRTFIILLIVLLSLDCMSHGKKLHTKHKHTVGRRSKVSNLTRTTFPDIHLINITSPSNNSDEAMKTENAWKKSVQNKDGKKDMSAIVVIGNKTRRISGPVIKELLSELQKQNEADAQNKNEIGDSGSSNSKRLYAANEVAEINKLLGKPLTDAKALGLIKNLLLDKVHSHLAKTMEGEQFLETEQHQSQELQQQQQQFQSEYTCRDSDPMEKCQYLKEMGLCNEGSKHPHIRRRCQQTCGMCDSCSNCGFGGCPGCTTIRGWQVDIEIPGENLQGNRVGQRCPTECVIRRTTPFPPTFLRTRTTPNPVFILADNTPLPRATVTPRPTYPPECDEQIVVMNRPTICPPRTAPTLPPIRTRTTPHIPRVFLPTIHRTTRHMIMQPSLSTSNLNVFNVHPHVAPPATDIHAVPTNTYGRPAFPHVNNLFDPHSPLIQPIQGQPTPEESVLFPAMNSHPLNQPVLMEQDRLPAVPPGSTAAVFSLAGKCQLPLDIGIAIDTSAATVPHWQDIRRFVTALIDRFQLGGISRIGIITFDTLAKFAVPLGAVLDAFSLKQRVNMLRPDPYGKRRTDLALELAANALFSTGRAGVPKILYLLEHGHINGGDPSIDWRQMLFEPSQRLRKMGVNVFAIGATPIATLDELNTISSTQDLSHSIPLQGYGQLAGIVPQVATKACKLAGSVEGIKCVNCDQTCVHCIHDDEKRKKRKFHHLKFMHDLIIS